MTSELALSDDELAAVRQILREQLPPDISVHVFGSRAGGRVKPWSDLDLVLEASGALPIALLGALAEAFEESELPWKVDLIDRKSASAEFGRLIDQSKVALIA